MGEGKLKIFCDPISTITGPYSSSSSLAASRNHTWVNMEEDDFASSTKSSFTSSSSFDESSSNASSSCEDLVDDASSSSSSSSSSTNGPLYELSDLMATLPIKRGLSKHFQGKSQSFTSLADVSCIEDLVKKETSFSRRKQMIKTCKSYGGGLDIQRKVISKKSSSAPRFGNKSGLGSSPRRPPLVPTKRSVFAITQS